MTGDELLVAALVLDGIAYVGQTISPEARTQALNTLNMMLGEFNATGQASYSVSRQSFNLLANQDTYTIGPGATFNTARPEKIESWSCTVPGGGASDDGIPMDAETFEHTVEDSNLVGTRIRALNYDSAFPIGNIHIYPKPLGGQILSLWTWSQLTEILDANTGLTLAYPPGYLKTILYNLAVDLAPAFGRPLDPTVKMIADQCKAALGATNASAHVPAGAPGPAAAA